MSQPSHVPPSLATGRSPTAVGLVARGACMGIADVIPGVSGGTMALVLGIYRPLLEAIRSVRLDLPKLALRALAGRFGPAARAPLVDALREIHVAFLLPLGAGIACAFLIGAKTIPGLMEAHPETMRGLFFGLILASVSAPVALMDRRSARSLGLAAALVVLVGICGYLITDPSRSLDMTSEWVSVRVPDGAPMSFKEVLRRGPAGRPAAEVFWAPQNALLREVVASGEQAALFGSLDGTDHHSARAADKAALKAEAALYAQVAVPAGTMVQVPRPSHGFIFLAGMIAICAMVLPGISGSFLLLVMGVYFFMLDAISGALHQLLHGEVPVASLAYIGLFCAGIAIGITGFARVLAWLLVRFPDPTMGALVGLMLGCLRGVWPWRDGLANALPADVFGNDRAALIAIAVGLAVVAALQFADARLRGRTALAR